MDWTRIVIGVALSVGVALLIALASRWMRRRPTRAAGGGVRLPIAIAILGWLLIVVGALMGLVAITSDVDDPVPMRIASVAIVAGGVFFLVLHRNWRLDAQGDRIYSRDVLGRVRCIVYDEIASSHLALMRGAPILEVRSIDDTRITTNCASFDVRPLLQAIADRGFRGHTGPRWDTSGVPTPRRRRGA